MCVIVDDRKLKWYFDTNTHAFIVVVSNSSGEETNLASRLYHNKPNYLFQVM